MTNQNSSKKSDQRIGKTIRDDLHNVKIKDDFKDEYRELKDYFLTDDRKETLKTMKDFQQDNHLDYQEKMIKDLDKQHKVDIDGKSVGMGTYIESQNIWNKGHLNAITGTGGVFSHKNMFEVNNGGVAITGDILGKALGINTKIKVINNPYADFQALLATQEIPSDPDQYLFWHSTQTGNISRYKSPKIDKLLEDGRKTLDKTERKDIYFDFQKSIVEETPAIFLFHPTVYTISKD